jgi:hypothetical protein
MLRPDEGGWPCTGRCALLVLLGLRLAASQAYRSAVRWPAVATGRSRKVIPFKKRTRKVIPLTPRRREAMNLVNFIDAHGGKLGAFRGYQGRPTTPPPERA